MTFFIGSSIINEKQIENKLRLKVLVLGIELGKGGQRTTEWTRDK